MTGTSVGQVEAGVALSTKTSTHLKLQEGIGPNEKLFQMMTSLGKELIRLVQLARRRKRSRAKGGMKATNGQDAADQRCRHAWGK